MNEPIIKWRTGGYGKTPIEKVECVKETAQFVWPVYGDFKPRQTAKSSEYHNYFDSWQDAYAFLRDKAETAVGNERRRLAEAEKALADLMKLEPPTP